MYQCPSVWTARIYSTVMTRFSSAGLVQIPGPAPSTGGSVWFRISPDSSCFDGHFDGAPVFPGVAHFAVALTACDQLRIAERPLIGLRDVRFSRPLHPGDEIEVKLTDGAVPSSMLFEVRCRGERASSGLLVFAGIDV